MPSAQSRRPARLSGLARLIPLLLFVSLALGLPSDASKANESHAEVRLALVVANGKYADRRLPYLPNTYIDGDRIASALTQTGFVDATGSGPVVPRRDLTEAQLRSELRTLAQRLKATGGNGFAVVYYSGHGASIGRYGDTLLLGVDQSPDTPAVTITRASIADTLLSTGSRTVLVVLDMCRTVSLKIAPAAAEAKAAQPQAPDDGEPAARGSRYVGSPRRADQGYLIAYSTSPDGAAFDDGVFSLVLAEEIVRPRQNIAEVFKRVSDRVAVVHAAGHAWQKPTFDYGLRGGGPCFTSCDPSDDGARFYDCANCPWMRVVPAGEVVLGSRAEERGRGRDEPPPHSIRFEQPFAIGVYTVTVAEWKACELDGACRKRPNWSKDNPNPLIPATHITYADAQAYVAWLSQKSGQIYRLPTDDEWEYAARAGARTAFAWGDDISPSQANYDHTVRYAGSAVAPYVGYPEAVTNYPPNAYGLVQMEGNVWQWTDRCEAEAGGACSRHVLRGGSFESDPRELRLANRFVIPDGKVREDVGLRVLRQIDPREGL